jgi:GT2 family glycosyltransferase
MTASKSSPFDKIGAVIIGRNEGERLINCLDSVYKQLKHVVYVDSGSTDDSVSHAQSLGTAVVALDMSRPFTAARARNAGFERLLSLHPDLRLVQFLDGDCALQSGWIDVASEFLQQNPEYAVATGRRKELHPEQSIYNHLCNIEWDTPIGEANYCGGDALIRSDAFQNAGGFRESLIAGEEPELCVRLRSGGWKIYRLDAEMTLHDAAILHFRQWWQRTKRAGHAFAEGNSLHGNGPHKHWKSEARRAMTWGVFLPAAITLLTFVNPAFIFFSGIYFLQFLRLSLKYKCFSQAALMVIGKFAEGQGALQYYRTRLSGRTNSLIEYK